jgi:hypothetical protein
VDRLASGGPGHDREVVPPLRERRAGFAQVGHEGREFAVVRVGRDRAAEVGDEFAAEPVVLLGGVHDRARNAAEVPPHEVAGPVGRRFGDPEKGVPERVRVDEVPARGEDRDRGVGEPVEDARGARADVPGYDAGGGRLGTGGAVEQVAFGGREAQRAGECREHLRRRVPRPSLLQPDEIVDRDPGQGGQLLAAQSGGTPRSGIGEPDIGRAHAVTP